MATNKNDIKQFTKQVNKVRSVLYTKLLELAEKDGKKLARDMETGFNRVVGKVTLPKAYKLIRRDLEGNVKHGNSWRFTDAPNLKSGDLDDASAKTVHKYANVSGGKVHCGIYGPSVVYYEFGTGTVGQSGNHPNKSQVEYLTGKKMRTYQYGRAVRNWRNLLSDEMWDGSSYVSEDAVYWLYKDYAIKGMKPQKFVYNAVQKYRQRNANETDNAEFHLTKKSIGAWIAKEFNDR